MTCVPGACRGQKRAIGISEIGVADHSEYKKLNTDPLQENLVCPAAEISFQSTNKLFRDNIA